MALSKDVIRPIWPKDFSTILREGRSVDGADFAPGTLVVRVNGLLVACDTDTALHKTLPAELVWTDGATRVDLARVELDGTDRQEHTCMAGQFMAECAASMFTATPAAGDVLVKSATAGQIDPLDATELATFVTGETDALLAELQVVGRVVGDADLAGTGFYLCHFDLG